MSLIILVMLSDVNLKYLKPEPTAILFAIRMTLSILHDVMMSLVSIIFTGREQLSTAYLATMGMFVCLCPLCRCSRCVLQLAELVTISTVVIPLICLVCE